MEAWAREFLDLWLSRNLNIATRTAEAIAQNAKVTLKYDVATLEQMFLGAHSMMTEELTNAGRDAREAYMESIWPTLLAEGEALAGIVSQVTINSIICYDELIPRMSDENRAKAASYLMWWFAGFNGEIVSVAMREFGLKRS